MMKGNKVQLRALEPEDLAFLFQIENDTSLWEVSHTQVPYSKFVLKKYLENAHRDIYDVKQLRLVIETLDKKTIGLIDLYDFDPKNKRAGVGIVISENNNRQKGYATEALRLLCEYAFNELQLHQLYAVIGTNNKASIALFENLSFIKSGTKKDWNFYNHQFHDEHFYQKINPSIV